MQAYIQSTSNLNYIFYIWPPPELILLLSALSNCVVKVMKPLYDILKAGNHWFATYHIHYKDKLGMIKSTYNPCLLYISSSFGIVRMQIDNILILADNDFTSTKEDTIKSAKTMTKDREHLTPTYFLKFNNAQIKLNLNGIVLTKKSYAGRILLIIDHVADSTSSKEIIRKKLLPKE